MHQCEDAINIKIIQTLPAFGTQDKIARRQWELSHEKQNLDVGKTHEQPKHCLAESAPSLHLLNLSGGGWLSDSRYLRGNCL